MNNFPIPRLLTLALCGVFALSGCAPDAAESQEESQSVAETEQPLADEPEAGAPADLPEVVVLYGKEDLVPWLESENWWGEESRDVQLTAPLSLIHI